LTVQKAAQIVQRKWLTVQKVAQTVQRVLLTIQSIALTTQEDASSTLTESVYQLKHSIFCSKKRLPT
ncbi:hypothetical protein KQ486_10740, partial [Allobacillus halotolerans]